MHRDELRFMLDYDAWATERVLATAEALDGEAFVASAGPDDVSPRDSLLHIVSGMRTWRARLDGTTLSDAAREDDFPTPAAVRALWQAEHALLQSYVARLTDDDLDEVLEQSRPDRALRAPRWQFVVHIVLHGMQHRSELAQTLTLLGHSPGELGLTAFLSVVR